MSDWPRRWEPGTGRGLGLAYDRHRGFGAFCAVAAEHPLATHAALGNGKLAAFIEECKRGPAIESELATQEKKGMPTGLVVRHPISGEAVPARYLLGKPYRRRDLAAKLREMLDEPVPAAE